MDEMTEYGYRLGLQDGRVAAQWIAMGRPVSHGDLLSSNDPYALNRERLTLITRIAEIDAILNG